MKLSRRIRSLTALLAVIGVFFAQIAVAAYACPGAQAMMLAAIGTEREANMPCCEGGVAEALPALCSIHCQQGDQSLDKPAPPDVPAIQWTAIPPGALVPHVPAAGPPGEQRSLLARATAPPVALRNCCLRV